MNNSSNVAGDTKLGDIVRHMDPGGGLWGPLGGASKVWFVDSVNGDDSYHGRTFDRAFATLDVAFDTGNCLGGRGDIVYVAPYHAEDLSDTNLIDADVAGVAIIGMGYGEQRPTFTYDHADALFSIGANDISLVNLRFLPSITIVDEAIEVEAGMTGVLLDHLEFMDGEDGAGTDEFINAILVSAACDDLEIRHCKASLHASAGGAESVIKLDGAQENLMIEDNDFQGPYSIGCINNETAALTRARFERNLLVPTSGQPGIELLVGSTGCARFNRIVTDVTTTDKSIAVTGGATLAATLSYAENYWVEKAPESGGLVGAVST